jgi:hypothetical protein
MADSEGWLTTAQAIMVLGISRTRLWLLTKEGRLTAHQRGTDRRARFYRGADVERLAREYRPVLRHTEDGEERGAC